MCKKIIALFATVILIFNVIFPSVVRADNKVEKYDGNSSSGFGDMTFGGDSNDERKKSFQTTIDRGAATVGGGTAGYSISDDTTSSLLKNLVKFLNIVPTCVRFVITLLTNDSDPTYVDDVKYGTGFSIQKTVFGKIRMFDVNFLHREENEDKLAAAVKNQIAKFYYITRNISIGLMLLVLLYTAIRMMISTIASDIAKYKTMIKDWVVGLIILMILQYIMVGILHLGTLATNLSEEIMTSMIEDEDEYKIEERMLEQGTQSTGKGWSIVIPTLVYWLLTYYQLKFFLMYFRRLMTMAFLVTIAPFITVSYAIDKARRRRGTSIKNMAFRICNGGYDTTFASFYIYSIHADCF